MLLNIFSKKRIIFILFPFALLCVFYLCKNVFAQEAKPSNVEITNTRDNLYLFMDIENAFNEELKSAILSGVPVSFSFYFYIEKVRSFWPNNVIRDKQITHTMTYDTLKKEFSVKKSWERGATETTHTFKEAREMMASVNGLRLVKLKRFDKGGHYRLKIKAKLNKLSLPYHLDYILFFISRWDFETEWYTLEFIY